MMESGRAAVYATALLALLVSVGGCVNLAANLIGVVQGNERPAEYDELEGKRVAIVCSTDSGVGNDTNSSMLAGYIHANLNSNIDDIDLVRQSEVERWLDSHGRSDADYVEIGKGVEADQLVAVEVVNVSLKNGATLFRGQADLTVSVYDIAEGGKVMFRKHIPEFTFPKMGGPTVTDTSEAKFRGVFFTILANRVSGLFYPVDVTADFALDATSNTF